MTLDEKTLILYEEIKAAVREGNLLMYAGQLARRLIEQPEQINSNTVRPPTPQPRRSLFGEQVNRLNNSPVGRAIPVPVREQITREVMDSVRVAQL